LFGEIVGGRLTVEGLTRHLEDGLIRQHRKIGAGNLRDERELRAASRLLVAEIPLERGAIQAADLAEQVELIGGKADAYLIEADRSAAGDRSSPAARGGSRCARSQDAGGILLYLLDAADG